MGSWLLIGLQVVTIGVVVNSKVDLDSPVRLAHCRAFCLHQIKYVDKTDAECKASRNCSQCWSSCEWQQKRQSFCDQSDCGMGCHAACLFRTHFPGAEPLVQLAPHEDVLSLTNSTVSWPAEPSGLPRVYAVIAQPQGQLLQTVGASAALPPDVDPCTVRVLVVGPNGLTKVLGPPQESPMDLARYIVRSLGLGKRMGLDLKNQTSSGNVTRIGNTSSSENIPKKLWMLREISRIHQAALVLVQIRWQPQQLPDSPQPVYLVTWQVGGETGLLRGNLLTNSTSVTLSLWPDTVYRIQVALFSPSSVGSTSELLDLDTHHSLSDPASVVHSDDVPHTHPVPSTQVVVGLAAAVAMFLLVTIIFTWRWHHRLSLPHSKLVDEDVGTSNLYRVFPPVVTLVAEPYDSPDLFSSTDNLLQATSVRK